MNTIEIETIDGKIVECEVIAFWQYKDKNYILYTDNELDENGNKEILASRYIEKGENYELEEIETEEEWNYIEECIDRMKNRK